MANSYIINDWISAYERDGGELDYDTDVLLSNSKVLLPGRFYILNYKAQTEKPYNARPVILSLGISKKEPGEFLCIDLCFIPYKIRINFIQTLFNMFENQITDNMNNFWNVEDADKQKQILQISYELLDKMPAFKPFKFAVKKYKIKNTYKIYSIPFSGLYKAIGKFADKNTFVNTSVADEQRKFIEESRKKK